MPTTQSRHALIDKDGNLYHPHDRRGYSLVCHECDDDAAEYWMVYDHNEVANPPCGLRRGDVLLVPACERHEAGVAEKLSTVHGQCMWRSIPVSQLDRTATGW